MLIFVIILSLGVDYYIWNDIRRYSPVRRNRLWRTVYAVSAVVCWIFLIVAVSLPRRDVNEGIQTVMWMLYAYSTVYVAKLVYVICSLIGCLLRRFFRRRNPGLYVGVPLAILCLIFMWWGVFFTRYEITVVREDVNSPKIPESFENYRIVQFSDAHVGTWGNDLSFVTSLVDTINSLHPDLIVFTGDIVNRQTAELQPFLPTLSRLHAKDGVISILGNHDYGDYITWNSPEERDANNELLKVWERQIGWRLLNNEHQFITRGNDSIAVIGIENWGEPPFKQYGDLAAAIAPHSSSDTVGLYGDSYKILLSHNPEHWNREVTRISNIDLTLSGHTHAMQMMVGSLGEGAFRWSPAALRYPQWAGMYKRSNDRGEEMNLYVNIGSGEVGMPMRLGSARPEVTLLVLHHER